MSDDLLNVNDLMRELEKTAIRTSQGTFIKREDVQDLLEKRLAANAITDADEPKPKTVEQARSQAKAFLAKQVSLPSGPREPGRAIPASETAQPPSRA